MPLQFNSRKAARQRRARWWVGISKHRAGNSASTKSSFAEALKNWITIVAILFAAGWGVYEFLYKEIIVPNTKSPFLIITANVKKGTEKEKMLPLQISVNIDNKSTREVYLLGGWINIWGFTPDFSSQRVEACKKFSGVSLNKYRRLFWCSPFVKENLRPSSWHEDEYDKPDGEVIYGAKFAEQSQRWKVSPNLNFSRDLLAYVPTKFAYIRIEIDVRYSIDHNVVVFCWNMADDGTIQEELWTTGEDGTVRTEPCIIDKSDDIKNKIKKSKIKKLELDDPRQRNRWRQYLRQNNISKTYYISEISLW